VREGSKNVVLWVEPKALGVVRVSGASSYGVSLASAWILLVEWAWLDYMCLHHKFYDSKSFLWHFQLWYTGICVCSHPCYVFMCVCEYGMSAMYVVWQYIFARHRQPTLRYLRSYLNYFFRLTLFNATFLNIISWK
jgi:hypothetical protein